MPVFSGIGQEMAKDAPGRFGDCLVGGLVGFANLWRIFDKECA